MIPIDWSSIFNLIQAIGSIATAAGFFILFYQINLTKKQLSQTQQEIDSTLRPWLGSHNFQVFLMGVDVKDVLRFQLKNYGRLPARLSGVSKRWSITEILQQDLAQDGYEPVEQDIYFPDQEMQFDIVSEQSFMDKKEEQFYVGIRIRYDYQVGQGKKDGEYGIILKCERSPSAYSVSTLSAWVT